MTRRTKLAAILLRSRKRRRAEGEHVCLNCGGDTYSGLRSWCPPCKLVRHRAWSQERERKRPRRDRDRTAPLFPEP